MRVKELAWLGQNSISVYLYHTFFFWVIGTVTGFPLKYGEDVPVRTVLLSLLVAVAAILLSVLCYVLVSKLPKPGEAKKEAA